jgi:hypothetical protein
MCSGIPDIGGKPLAVPISPKHQSASTADAGWRRINVRSAESAPWFAASVSRKVGADEARIHTGECEVKGTSLTGMAVQMASRTEGGGAPR